MFHEKVCQYQLSWDKSWKFIHHFHCFHWLKCQFHNRKTPQWDQFQTSIGWWLHHSKGMEFQELQLKHHSTSPHHTRVMMIFIPSGKSPVGTHPLFGREQWTYNLNSVHFNLWIKFEEYVSVCVNFNSILKFSLDNQVVFMLLFLRVCIWKVSGI